MFMYVCHAKDSSDLLTLLWNTERNHFSTSKSPMSFNKRKQEKKMNKELKSNKRMKKWKNKEVPAMKNIIIMDQGRDHIMMINMIERDKEGIDSIILF